MNRVVVNKLFIFPLLFLSVMLSYADEPKPIKAYIEDFSFLAGSWEGYLEYLDYGDNKTTIKLQMKVKAKKKTSTDDYQQYIHLQTEFTEPNGKTIENEVKVSEDGMKIQFDGEWTLINKEKDLEQDKLILVLFGKGVITISNPYTRK